MSDGPTPVNVPSPAPVRSPTSEEVRNKVVLEAFQTAWGARDIDALAELISPDCVYAASTGPEPGTTWTGRDDVVEGFRIMLARDPGNALSGETIYAGDKAFNTWSIETSDGTAAGAIRGCDLFEFRDGRITLKDAFRKTCAPSHNLNPLRPPADAAISPLIFGDMAVRAFNRDDVPELLELMKELARFEGYIDDFAITEADLIEFGLGAKPLFEALVATRHNDRSGPAASSSGGNILGMAVMYRLPWTYDMKPKLVMKELFVHESGRSRGVGKVLLHAVTERARQLSASNLNWTVLHNNERAKQFYLAHGGQPDSKWHPWTLEL